MNWLEFKFDIFSIHYLAMTNFCILVSLRMSLYFFDLQVNKPHEPSDFNLKLIGRSWCQTTGKWGQGSQFSCQFLEKFIKNSKLILHKSVVNSRQLPVSPVSWMFFLSEELQAREKFNFSWQTLWKKRFFQSIEDLSLVAGPNSITEVMIYNRGYAL